MTQQLTREQLEFARSIGATKYFRDGIWFDESTSAFFYTDSSTWSDGFWIPCSIAAGDDNFPEIDFSPLDEPEPEYVPKVGEECEARNKLNSGDWVKITPDYVGNEVVVFTMGSGKDTTLYRSLSEFRPLPDPEQQRRDELLEKWQSRSLDNAHDTEASVLTVGDMVDFIIDLEGEQ